MARVSHIFSDLRHARLKSPQTCAMRVRLLAQSTLTCAISGYTVPVSHRPFDERQIIMAMWVGHDAPSVSGWKRVLTGRLTANFSLLATPSARLTIVGQTPSFRYAEPLPPHAPAPYPFPPIPSVTSRPHPFCPFSIIIGMPGSHCVLGTDMQ